MTTREMAKEFCKKYGVTFNLGVLKAFEAGMRAGRMERKLKKRVDALPKGKKWN